MKIVCIALGFICSVISCFSAAYEQNWSLEYGGLVNYQSTIYQGQPSEIQALPYINAAYGQWEFGMKHGIARYRLTNSANSLQAWLGIGLRDQTYDGLFSSDSDKSDHPIFFGYQDGDYDITATAKLAWQGINVQLEQDISNHSQALAGAISYDVFSQPLTRNLILKANIGARWYSQDYVDYVYGINGSNINEQLGRVAYQGDAALNPLINLSMIYQIDRQWTIVARLEAESIDDGIVDSPLVDEDKRYGATILLTYRGN
ncbi:MipA/OmpV family protein [Thalassotalea ganghwensis]